MPELDDWWARRHEVHRRRRERIREVLLGGAPPFPPWVRVALPGGAAVLGYICYRFRLTSAKGYEVLALALVAMAFIGRRVWWKRQQARLIRDGACPVSTARPS